MEIQTQNSLSYSNVEPQSIFQRVLDDHALILQKLSSLEPAIELASDILKECLKSGKTILLAGNGGSASDAQHIAGEFVGRYLLERKGASAIALGASDAALTSIGNDYGFDQVYSRQVEAYRNHAGLLIAYSTSGNSPNIIRAIEQAQTLGIPVIGFSGETGGKMMAMCNVCLCVPSSETPRIQEMHIVLGHILCEMVEPGLE